MNMKSKKNEKYLEDGKTIQKREVIIMKKVELNVIGMSCGHCTMVIENSVGSLPGVEKVLVDVKNGNVAVEFHPNLVSLDKIKETIGDQGYDIG
ncbi:copper ion binding protein [Neobacillus drentensis]|uniref:copper ion binding protein n=1 Tax=Neobacillus drentensis TaxID=220684 RepID=UPI0030029F85